VEVLVVVVISESLLVDGPEGTIRISVDVRVSTDGVIQSQGQRNLNAHSGRVVVPLVERSGTVDGCGRGGKAGSEDGFTISGESSDDESSIIASVPFEVRVAFGRIASYRGIDMGATRIGARSSGTGPEISYKTV